MAHLPAPTGPLPPSPCPTRAHPAWVTGGRPLWTLLWELGSTHPRWPVSARPALTPGSHLPPPIPHSVCTLGYNKSTPHSCCQSSRSRAAAAQGSPSASGEASGAGSRPAPVASGFRKSTFGREAPQEELGQWGGRVRGEGRGPLGGRSVQGSMAKVRRPDVEAEAPEGSCTTDLRTAVRLRAEPGSTTGVLGWHLYQGEGRRPRVSQVELWGH